MKKILALVIATIMCFSLVACGEKATEESSGTTNQTTNETTEKDITNADDEAEVSYLYQEWKSLESESTFEFSNNGKVTVDDSVECDYNYDATNSNIIMKYGNSEIVISVIDVNGTYKLVPNTNNENYVSTNDYEKIINNKALFCGEWEYNSNGGKSTITIELDNADFLNIRVCNIDGTASSHTCQEITDTNIIYDTVTDGTGNRYVIDTSANPLTLTQVDDETVVYTKVE